MSNENIVYILNDLVQHHLNFDSYEYDVILIDSSDQVVFDDIISSNKNNGAIYIKIYKIINNKSPITKVLVLTNNYRWYSPQLLSKLASGLKNLPVFAIQHGID